MNRIVSAVLEGGTQVSFDEPVTVYEDDQKARFTRIFETINKESCLTMVMFYKDSLEEILIYLEEEGIKMVGVAGIGRSAYVLEGVLTRDVSPSAKRGKRVVAKVARRPRLVTTQHNSIILRGAANAKIITFRMKRSKSWSNLCARPVYALSGGRSSVGHTAPNAMSNHVILFSILEFVEERFENTLAKLASQWRQDVTVSNELVLYCQNLLLGLWHVHRNGVYIGSMANIGQTSDGKVVFCNLSNGGIGPPKGGK